LHKKGSDIFLENKVRVEQRRKKCPPSAKPSACADTSMTIAAYAPFVSGAAFFAVIFCRRFLLSLFADVFALSMWIAVTYSSGALIYAFRWPDPCPTTFGFHGIWHLLVVAGAAAFFCLLLSIAQTGPPAPL
jgi:hypothetical protein